MLAGSLYLPPESYFFRSYPSLSLQVFARTAGLIALISALLLSSLLLLFRVSQAVHFPLGLLCFHQNAVFSAIVDILVHSSASHQ